MEQSKQIEALRETISAREAEVNVQLASCEMILLDANLRIEAFALRGVEPRFGLALEWKEREGEWFLGIRRKANSWRWSEASIEDRTHALKLIDPLLSRLIGNATHLARAINATLPEE